MKRNKQSGRISFWDLLIVALVGVLAYLLYLRGHLDPYLPEQYASQLILGTGQAAAPQASQGSQAPQAPSARKPKASPAEPAPASHGTTLSSATPVDSSSMTASESLDAAPELSTKAPEATRNSPPQASAEPTPPARINLATLDRRHWPKIVKLRRSMQLPVIMGGKQVGSMEAPIGMELPVVEINAREVIVKNGDGIQNIAAGDTDVFERVYGIMKAVSATPRR